MGDKRRSVSQSEEVDLVTQVERVCPLCVSPLFYKKGRKSFKQYEIAHIYPLNPLPDEVQLLKNEVRLSDDVNDIKNLIPLCGGCHTRFDKPRTVEEYRQLVEIKKNLQLRSEQQSLQHEYQLQEEIGAIVKALDENDFSQLGVQLSLTPKSLDDKFNSSMPIQTRRKIRGNVSDYFVQIRQRFQVLDREKPGAAALISSQIKTYYLAQKQRGWNQTQIFSGMVEWIITTTKPASRESAEIVASFFVQNCEIFE